MIIKLYIENIKKGNYLIVQCYEDGIYVGTSSFQDKKRKFNSLNRNSKHIPLYKI